MRFARDMSWTGQRDDGSVRCARRLWCTGYRRDGRERVSNPEIGWIGNNSKHSACGCGGLTTNLDDDEVVEEEGGVRELGERGENNRL